MSLKKPLSLYIHWPFCRSKCPYCDFNSHVRSAIDEERYQRALLTELSYTASLIPAFDRELVSIFFGGGTPSLMRPSTVDALISHAHKLFPVAPNLEITLEGNPTSIEQKRYAAFKSAGINRVSIGIQSLHEHHLKFLGRNHSAKEAMSTVDMATELFSRVSVDLIYALPDQTLKEWMRDLEFITQVGVEHLSLYQLTIEQGTPFFNRFHRGDFSLPGEMLSSDFYITTNTFLDKAGLPAYELSNHAQNDKLCRHNLSYWTYQDYIGIGPGAHGRFTNMNHDKIATEMIRTPESWLRTVETCDWGLREHEIITPRIQMIEHLLMNFRLIRGIDKIDFRSRYGHEVYDLLKPTVFKDFIGSGFLFDHTDAVGATKKGLLALDRVLRDVLIDDSQMPLPKAA